MFLTLEQKQKTLYLLGYKNLDVENINSEFLPQSIERINQINNEITAIDLRLEEARSDSMAVKVDDLNVDYKQHVQHLLSEGSRLLKELSFIVDLPLVYNRYKNSSTDLSGDGGSSGNGLIVDYF